MCLGGVLQEVMLDKGSAAQPTDCSASGCQQCPAGTIWRGNEVIEGVLDSVELLRKLVRVTVKELLY